MRVVDSAERTSLEEWIREFAVTEIARCSTAHRVVLVDTRLQSPFLAFRQLIEVLVNEAHTCIRNTLTACFMRTHELRAVESLNNHYGNENSSDSPDARDREHRGGRTYHVDVRRRHCEVVCHTVACLTTHLRCACISPKCEMNLNYSIPIHRS